MLSLDKIYSGRPSCEGWDPCKCHRRISIGVLLVGSMILLGVISCQGAVEMVHKAEDAVGEFVLLLPPQSLAINQISIGLELFRRGNRVTIVTLEEGRKYFDEQLQRFNRSAIPSNVPQIELLVVGELPATPDFAEVQETLSHSNNVSIISLRSRFDAYIKTLMTSTLDGLEDYKKRHPNHPVLSKSARDFKFPRLAPLYILPLPARTGILYLRNHGHSYVLTMPVAAMASRLSLLPYTSLRSNSPFNKTILKRMESLLASVYSWVCLNFPSLSFLKEIRLDLLYDRPQLKLVNGIPQMAAPQTFSPLTVFTGPVVSTERLDFHSLSSEARRILESGSAGEGDFSVAFLSFGTNARLSGAQVDKVVEVFIAPIEDNSTRWRILWALPEQQRLRMSRENLAKVQKLTAQGKLLIVQWIQVPAVLQHHNVKLFVSHCGGSSMNEALVTGVPVFGVPMFGDQHLNCASARDFLGVAEVHNFRDTDCNELRDAFKRLIKQNIDSHPLTLNAQKAKVLTTTIYNGIKNTADWLEVAYRTGNDFAALETPVEREGVVKSYCLDFLAVFLAVVGVFAVAGFRQLCFGMPRKCKLQATREKKD